jgi:hypothetical protein
MALDLDQYSAMLSFGLIAPKSFKIIWLSNVITEITKCLKLPNE